MFEEKLKTFEPEVNGELLGLAEGIRSHYLCITRLK